MEAFYVVGSALAVLALLVSLLGITRKSFPGSVGVERLIGLVFAVMVIAAVATAVIGAANEAEESEDEEHAALVSHR